MGYRPLPMINGCPNCGARPEVKYRLFRGHRAECRCGVSGPFVVDGWPEHAALAAWSIVAGDVRLPYPPPAHED